MYFKIFCGISNLDVFTLLQEMYGTGPIYVETHEEMLSENFGGSLQELLESTGESRTAL